LNSTMRKNFSKMNDISNILFMFLIGWIVTGIILFSFVYLDRIRVTFNKIIMRLISYLPAIRDALFLLTPLLIPIIVCLMGWLFEPTAP